VALSPKTAGTPKLHQSSSGATGQAINRR